MTRSKAVAVAIAGVLALTLGACSSDPGDGGEKGGRSSTPERDPLPLDAFWESTNGEFDEEKANAQQMEVEELTAECMAGEGFEYTPVDYSTMGGGVTYTSDDDLEFEWGSREFAEKYGYGVTTNPWGDQVSEPMPEETQQEWTDPNQEYLESMSEAEQEAYYTALYGDQSIYEDWTEEDWENYEWSWEDSGCSGWASNEIFGDQMGGSGSEFDQLWADMDAMWTAAQEDPRLSEAVNKWSVCMADAGYPGLTDIYQAQEQFYEKTNGIWDEVYEGVDWEDPNLDYEALDAQVQERLAEFTDEEIATAVAEWDCKDESGYADVEYEVQKEYQQDFLDTHKAELDAYAESMK